jgi:hypothetical protein
MSSMGRFMAIRTASGMFVGPGMNRCGFTIVMSVSSSVSSSNVVLCFETATSARACQSKQSGFAKMRPCSFFATRVRTVDASAGTFRFRARSIRKLCITIQHPRGDGSNSLG